MDATDFSDFCSTVLAGYLFLGNKMTHLEGAAMFDLIVRTVGEKHFMHSCDEKIFSGSVVQIIVRKKP